MPQRKLPSKNSSHDPAHDYRRPDQRHAQRRSRHPHPPRESAYDHVGEIIYIDESGRIQRDIGYWYRFLNFVTNALEDLKKALQTTVKDHSMTLYCGHLERAA